MAEETHYFVTRFSGPDKPLTLLRLPIPTAVQGSVVIHVLATALSPNEAALFSGKFGPGGLQHGITPGQAAIGRIHTLGPDATSLQPNQLVFTDFFIAARDNPDISILSGFVAGQGPAATLQAAWPYNSFAQYACVPLERVWALDAARLCGELGYTARDLSYLGALCISMAGLLELGVQAGDTVVVAPATGLYGGATIPAALALGVSKVVACGRNEAVLTRMEEVFGEHQRQKGISRFAKVVLTGDDDTDTSAIVAHSGGKEGPGFYFDFTPPQAEGNTNHIGACIAALKHGGKAAIMGHVSGLVGVPYGLIAARNLHIQGQFMFERRHVLRVLRLVEMGALKLGEAGCGIRSHGFRLNQIQQAVDKAAELRGWGDIVVLEPWS